MMDGDIVYIDTTYTEVTTNQTAKQIYDEFLDQNELINLIMDSVAEENKKEADEAAIKDKTDDDDTEVLTDAIEMEQRESELMNAFAQFISVAVQDCDDNYPDNEMFNEVYEHTLAYLYQEFGIDIYRPMVIEYADGSEEYKEYPYDSLALDDF